MRNRVFTRRWFIHKKMHKNPSAKKSEIKNKKTTHPIEKTIDSLIHAILDIRSCSEKYIPNARLVVTSEMQECTQELKDFAQNLRGAKDVEAAHEIAKFFTTIRKLKRAGMSRSPDIMQESLFIQIFSAFDRFIGRLITSIFNKKEDLFSSIERNINFSELLNKASINDVKHDVLEKEIETLRRQSYVEQFKWLETFFGLKLTVWKDWSKFIESGQRRNLLAHSDGIVSSQYIKVCNSVGYKFEKLPKVGDRLKLKDDYFRSTTSVVMDAGVMLAHTLWRKVFPDEINEADSSINDLIYDFLYFEMWDDAKRIGEFRLKQKLKGTDLSYKMAAINLSIAMKFCGSNDYERILNSIDWSSALPEFKMAVHVLRDEFMPASETMLEIGKQGQIVSEIGYHTWPLFRTFRQSEYFLRAYHKIYGYKFERKAEMVAEDEASHLRRRVLTQNENEDD